MSQVINKRVKLHYGFTYPSHMAALPFNGGKLAVKLGDAYDTYSRWKNSDIAGANEAQKKIPIIVDWAVDGVKRDYDYRDLLHQTYGKSYNLDGSGTEWHYIPVPSIYYQNKNPLHQDVQDKIRQFIKSEVLRNIYAKFSPLNIKPQIVLRNLQEEVIDRILNNKDIFVNDIATIVAELCPRFGKTITFLELFRRMNQKFNTKVMIVGAYWLSVLTSYEDEIKKWRDFENIAFLDSANATENDFQNAMAQNKLVVIGFRLTSDTIEKDKFQWINDITCDTLFISDEADFGSHQINQREKINILLSNKKTVKIVTSGTNALRMSKGLGNKVSDFIRIPYSVLEEKELEIIKRQLFQAYIDEELQSLIKEKDEKVCPSWTKILEKSLAQKQFLSGFFRAIYGYDTEYGLTINDLSKTDVRVSMIFVSCNKEGMEGLKKVIDVSCPNHQTVILNGDYTTNREAEKLINIEIANIKNSQHTKDNLVIISNTMGSRSFSIREVQACITLIDNGSIDAFTQKISRCCTPGNIIDGDEKTLGHIFSFGFDLNRTRDSASYLILNEAKQVLDYFKDKNEFLTYPDAVRYVLNSVNLKTYNYNGHAFLEEVGVEDFLDLFTDTDIILDVCELQTDYDGIRNDDELMKHIKSLKNIKFSKETLKKIDAALKKGKNYGYKNKKTSEEENINDDDWKKVIAFVEKILSSATTVLAFTNFQGQTYIDCLNIIESDKMIYDNFIELYDFNINDIRLILNYLPIALLDIAIFSGDK